MPRPGAMFYLVTYDLPSTREGDRRRSRLAKRLEGLGLRVQFSVFELEVSPEALPAIVEDLAGIIDESEDSLRVYPFCATCRAKVIRVGKEAVCEHESILIW